MSSFKLYFLKSSDPSDVDFIRRIRTSSSPTWDNFLGLLRSLFPQSPDLSFVVQWCDEDGDYITLGSQLEWDEALSSVKAWPFKLFVQFSESVKKENVVESGEIKIESSEGNEVIKFTVSTEYFYESDGKEVSATPDEQAHIQETVPQIVERLITSSGGNLPPWLTGAVKFVPCPQGSGDLLLDIDLALFSTTIHQYALDLLDHDDKLSEAESVSLLRDCAKISPGDRIVAYNLACALSRVGSLDEAFASLDRYVSFGEPDFGAILSDTDFKNLRNSPQFDEWLKNKSNQTLPPSDSPKKAQSTVTIEDLDEDFEQFFLIQKEQEAQKLVEAARKAEEEALKALEEARRLEEEAKELEERARLLEEAARKAEKEAQKAEEEAKKAQEEAERAAAAEEEAKKNEKPVSEQRARALEVLTPMGFDVDVLNSVLDLVNDDLDQALEQLMGE